VHVSGFARTLLSGDSTRQPKGRRGGDSQLRGLLVRMVISLAHYKHRVVGTSSPRHEILFFSSKDKIFSFLFFPTCQLHESHELKTGHFGAPSDSKQIKVSRAPKARAGKSWNFGDRSRKKISKFAFLSFTFYIKTVEFHGPYTVQTRTEHNFTKVTRSEKVHFQFGRVIRPKNTQELHERQTRERGKFGSSRTTSRGKHHNSPSSFTSAWLLRKIEKKTVKFFER